MLELLAGGDFTVTALADRLGVLQNSASKAISRAREEGEVHICGYAPRTAAAIYRLSGGVDAARPAPVVLAPSCRDDWSLVKAPAVSESVLQYFELDVLSGVKHFTCDLYKATLSVESCADKFRLANSSDAFGRHAHCKRCPIGAAHSGAGPDLNLGRLKGSLTCGRCHRASTRLIGRHICVSCFNRARELRIGKNGKGNAPVRLARLDPRSITYRAGGVVKTRKLLESVDTEELIVAVLRDEEHTPEFGWRARASMDWLLSDEFDRSIPGDVDEVVPVAVAADALHVADRGQGVREQGAIVADTLGDVAAPVPAALNVVQAGPYDALRDALEHDDRDVPPSMPTTSRRAAKKLRQQAQRQVRVSAVTVGLLRTVCALPPPVPVIVPPPSDQPIYRAIMFAV
ncbi:hypothetical protein J2785_007268 [Burkholderia ambifaria]|nr:hypothetical protein [Burkholderia ambifaria]MDR6504074.1 hypothetical protein [Burkholderia ambifaria]